MDLKTAIINASNSPKSCVGWDKKAIEWVTYNPIDGAPDGVQPELLCFHGKHPVPLSIEGQEALTSLINSLYRKYGA